MKKGLKDIISVILILFFLLCFARFLISCVENTIPTNRGYCKLVYNTEEHSSEKFFGSYCAEINRTSKTITKHHYTHKEMMDYCGRIGFWELTKWINKCS